MSHEKQNRRLGFVIALFVGLLTMQLQTGLSVAQEKPNAPVFQQGILSKEDPLDRIRKGRHVKIIPFLMEAGKTYQIDLESQAFDTYLRLEDPEMKSLAEDDDGGEGLNARIFFSPLRSDAFRIVVTSFAPGATGPFTLRIGTAPGLKVIPGKLTADPKQQDQEGRYWQLHEETLEAGRSYRIDLESEEFDSYLRLEDAQGKVLQEDDDSGNGLNARIRFTPAENGIFRLRVTTFAPAATGAYKLKISTTFPKEGRASQPP